MAKLDWTDVDSTNVQAVAYDEGSETLCMRFHNGGLYSYQGVEMEVYSGLIYADSVGQFLAAKIKGLYPYLKWSSEDEMMADIQNRRK